MGDISVKTNTLWLVEALIIPPVLSHLTLWGCLGWLLSQQQWSRSLCTQSQTATLQTETAGSKNTMKNVEWYLSFTETTTSHWMKQTDLRKGGKDIGISPETLFWLVHARWDAAERERSGYLTSPSHQSMLEHPKIWQRLIFILKKAAASWVFQCSLHVSIKDKAVVTHYYLMTGAWPCLCCNHQTADVRRGIDSMKD